MAEDSKRRSAIQPSRNLPNVYRRKPADSSPAWQFDCPDRHHYVRLGAIEHRELEPLIHTGSQRFFGDDAAAPQNQASGLIPGKWYHVGRPVALSALMEHELQLLFVKSACAERYPHDCHPAADHGGHGVTSSKHFDRNDCSDFITVTGAEYVPIVHADVNGYGLVSILPVKPDVSPQQLQAAAVPAQLDTHSAGQATFSAQSLSEIRARRETRLDDLIDT